MLLEIFKDSIEYSYKDHKSIFKLSILLILSPFLIPLLLVSGYSYRITNIGLNGTINGDDPLPDFENLGHMLVEGIKLCIVRFIYLLPGIIVFLALSVTVALLTFSEAPYPSTIFQSISFVLIELGIIALTISLWIIFYLFSTVAIPNMINNNGSLISAFNFKEIISIIKSIGFVRYIRFYLGCIVLVIGIVGTMGIIISLLVASITFLIGLSGNIVASVIAVIILNLFSIIAFLLLISFFITFESRAIALIYNMRELD